ncbi:hypothetical protein AYO20_11609 [Fonsecaea nubica]|uniref:Uncharacterized protein n=1 Tax=Fonsecaea nubica TaxID=856822 RepID=A0A178BPQ3_9EURO|nr:hypothetical protein AYO20_11609 [Fonsecaea nubica]OAL19649.1 hypothetical protein AYO20_11609 [Fonsecaea nubica]
MTPVAWNLPMGTLLGAAVGRILLQTDLRRADIEKDPGSDVYKNLHHFADNLSIKHRIHEDQAAPSAQTRSTKDVTSEKLLDADDRKWLQRQIDMRSESILDYSTEVEKLEKQLQEEIKMSADLFEDLSRVTNALDASIAAKNGPADGPGDSTTDLRLLPDATRLQVFHHMLDLSLTRKVLQEKAAIGKQAISFHTKLKDLLWQSRSLVVAKGRRLGIDVGAGPFRNPMSRLKIEMKEQGDDQVAGALELQEQLYHLNVSCGLECRCWPEAEIPSPAPVSGARQTGRGDN